MALCDDIDNQIKLNISLKQLEAKGKKTLHYVPGDAEGGGEVCVFASAKLLIVHMYQPGQILYGRYELFVFMSLTI